MAALELELNLPEGLREEAQAEGLLDPESITSLLCDEIRRRRTNKLFTAADRLANLGEVPLSELEIEAEIQAARKQLHAPDASRS